MSCISEKDFAENRVVIDLSKIPDGQIGESELMYSFAENFNANYLGLDLLPKLMHILIPIVDWINFGTYLGLQVYSLKIIEEEQRGKIGNCKREMLQEWLKNAEDTTKIRLYESFLKYKYSHPTEVS